MVIYYKSSLNNIARSTSRTSSLLSVPEQIKYTVQCSIDEKTSGEPLEYHRIHSVYSVLNLYETALELYLAGTWEHQYCLHDGRNINVNENRNMVIGKVSIGISICFSILAME